MSPFYLGYRAARLAVALGIDTTISGQYRDMVANAELADGLARLHQSTMGTDLAARYMLLWKVDPEAFAAVVNIAALLRVAGARDTIEAGEARQEVVAALLPDGWTARWGPRFADGRADDFRLWAVEEAQR